MLNDVPNGASCFIDATVFYYHLVGAPPLSDDCSDFLRRVALREVNAITSAVAVAEATHKVMLAEVVQRHGVDQKGLIARIKRHPELLDGLAQHTMVSKTIDAMGLRVESITLNLLIRGADLSSQWRLLTNDALALAVMEMNEIGVIASNDDDFDRVAGITVFKPARP